LHRLGRVFQDRHWASRSGKLRLTVLSVKSRVVLSMGWGIRTHCE
jgi:hypothetical protein